MAGKRRVFTASTSVSAKIEQVWEFHSRPAALETLSPPDMRILVGDKGFHVTEGASLLIWMSPNGLPFRLPWVSKFVDVSPPEGFTDVQTIGPFAYWQHTHAFERSGDNTIIHDRIEYAVPGWQLGDLLVGNLVSRQLNETFEYRRQRLTSHAW